MSNNLRSYLELEQRLFIWRIHHLGDTPEEDSILDEMDEIWKELTPHEIEWINARSAEQKGKGAS